ncbi:ATP-binding protein [Streptomyces sp. NPDC003631]|uniref:ATP-binding protein n=1 Tax=Streptomyces lannensis TaxID=766498 RepID=A0ABP7K3S9_9ACTN|nr:ATP-binding protein [Streptomyces sp. WAC07094]TFV31368.1 ATP-binding protein [Streptomyces sp. T1317-0309]
MATEPRWDNKTWPFESVESLKAGFKGELHDVTDSRLAAEEFLRRLARASPPTSPEHWNDILLVVDELAANAVQYAPGPFGLWMRPTFDGVHVTLHDTSTTPPSPRPFRPGRAGGIGWHLVNTLCDQVSVVVHPDGKDVHVFLPW